MPDNAPARGELARRHRSGRRAAGVLLRVSGELDRPIEESNRVDPEGDLVFIREKGCNALAYSGPENEVAESHAGFALGVSDEESLGAVGHNHFVSRHFLSLSL